MPSVIPQERSRRSIPLTRLDHTDPRLFASLIAAVEAVASTGGFVGGDELAAFESEFADYCGAGHAVGVSSGTEALALTLRALKIGPGDEVVAPTNSFIATAEAITLVGGNAPPGRRRPGQHSTDHPRRPLGGAHLNTRTRCVIVVHLYGRTADVDPLPASSPAPRGLHLVEDACQAHGAYYRGRRVGSLGDAGCFSFYPAKNLGAWGDGGAIVTNDPALAERGRRCCVLTARGPGTTTSVAGTTARLDAPSRRQCCASNFRQPGRLERTQKGKSPGAASRVSSLSQAPPSGCPRRRPRRATTTCFHSTSWLERPAATSP